MPVSDVSPWLPEDMVAEIMTWLPVESVLKFKCVCKKWSQLIQQDDFHKKHLRRAAMGCYYQKEYINQFCEEFSCIDIQKGLLLEQEHRKDPSGRLRIRNPATNQMVYLPELRVGDESPGWVLARMFFVANECTVISFSEELEGSILSGRFRAITVGVDAEWRPLKNSPPNTIHRISNYDDPEPMIFSLSIEKIYYVVTIDDDHDKNILWVDAKDESIKTLKIPENFTTNWRGVLPGERDSKLCFYCRDENEIKIWVLMNPNNNEWANFKTQTAVTWSYPISYLTKEEKTLVGEMGYKFDEIKHDIDIIHGFVHKTVHVTWRMKEELSIKPSILQLKGMHFAVERNAITEIDETMGRKLNVSILFGV